MFDLFKDTHKEYSEQIEKDLNPPKGESNAHKKYSDYLEGREKGLTMSQKPYGKLGDLDLVVSSGIKSLSQSDGYDYARHSLISGTDVLQPMGRKLRTYKIRIGFYLALGQDVEGNRDLLLEMVGSGESYPFSLLVQGQSASATLSGDGSSLGMLGWYVIESLDAEIKRIDHWGNWQSVEFDIELTEKVDREVEEIEKIEKKPTRKAKKKQKSTTEIPVLLRAEKEREIGTYHKDGRVV